MLVASLAFCSIQLKRSLKCIPFFVTVRKGLVRGGEDQSLVKNARCPIMIWEVQLHSICFFFFFCFLNKWQKSVSHKFKMYIRTWNHILSGFHILLLFIILNTKDYACHSLLQSFLCCAFLLFLFCFAFFTFVESDVNSGWWLLLL